MPSILVHRLLRWNAVLFCFQARSIQCCYQSTTVRRLLPSSTSPLPGGVQRLTTQVVRALSIPTALRSYAWTQEYHLCPGPSQRRRLPARQHRAKWRRRASSNRATRTNMPTKGLPGELRAHYSYDSAQLCRAHFMVLNPRHQRCPSFHIRGAHFYCWGLYLPAAPFCQEGEQQGVRCD